MWKTDGMVDEGDILTIIKPIRKMKSQRAQRPTASFKLKFAYK